MPLPNWTKASKKEHEKGVDEDAQYQSLLQDELELNPGKADCAVNSPSRTPMYLILGSTLLLIISTVLFSLSFYIVAFSAEKNCEDELSRHTAYYSPALESMMPHWGPRLWAQHVLESNESIWRQPPSDNVDAAWNRVTDVAMLQITREQLLRLGKDPRNAVHTPLEWVNVNEDERYLAIIDGMHLLHCLNSMRKSLYHNYHHYFPDGYPSSFGAHLSHCQETLAHWLMCQPSIEFISFGWYQRREPPFPDFDITRKCVDFERILDWQNENRIEGLTKPMFDALRPPEEGVRRTAPVMYDEILDHAWDEILDSAEERMWSDEGFV
ncbi:hypothetical protein GGR57DRAFT_517635 [Xylariaceae sp. FL1272]|nr:hypothetical protein GGR57DRAFT_517635 [Xylariaceae sp. FL1272]